MKTLCFLVFFLNSSTVLNSQQIQALEKSLDSLNNLKTYYQKQLSYINQEYTRIEKILNQKRFEQSIGDIYVCISGTNIYKSPTELQVLAHINKNEKVRVIDQDEKNYKVIYNNITGWMIKIALKSERELISELQLKEEKRKSDSIKIAAKIIELREADAKAEKVRKEADAKAEKVRKEALIARKNNLVKKYGANDGQRILEGKIWLGMTDIMARESWGTPDDINRSVGSWGVHEQWIYGDTYLYFENGKLTSWQD